MKKILFIMIVLLSFITRINALEYSCSISGDSIMYPYSSSRNESEYMTHINVSITNIDNIASFNMYAEFDKDLYSLNGCHLLNYNTSECSLSYKSNSKIFYNYEASDSYNLIDYPFYYINFIANKNTPSSGSTKINVYFENAKDKEGTDIEIIPCTTKISFKSYSKKEETTEEYIPSSTYISSLIIDGYDFEFDKETQDYKLKVDSYVNKLDINVELESEYSKYSITGASDLNSFGNKVIINVTNNDGEERIYTINVIREKEIINTNDIKGDIKSAVKSNTLKKLLPYILIICIVLLSTILIIRKKGSSKIDKYLDQL